MCCNKSKKKKFPKKITDANWSCPSRNQPRDGFTNDRLSEDGSSQDVSDGSVGREPHLLKAELDDAFLVGGDGRALDGDVVLHRRDGGVDCHLNKNLKFTIILDANVFENKFYKKHK